MIKCDIDIHLFCDVCESELSGAVVQGDIVYIDRCEQCLTESYQLGYKEAMRIDQKKVEELVNILEGKE